MMNVSYGSPSRIQGLNDRILVQIGRPSKSLRYSPRMTGKGSKLTAPMTPVQDKNAAEPVIRSQVFVSRHIKSQTLNLFLYNLFSHRKHLHQTKRKRSGLRNLT